MYRSLVVLLEDDVSDSSVLDEATSLAKASNGYISGVYVIPLTPTMISMPDIVNVESFRNRAQQVREKFESAIKAAGVQGNWHYTEGGDIVAEVAQRSLYADLLVLRRSKENHTTIDKILLTSSCPTLLLPPSKMPSTNIDRVLVAWKGTREAARTLHDTLPLLHNAQEIILAVFGEIDDQDKQSLTRYLATHGIDAKIEQHPLESSLSEKSIGQRLLALAKEKNAELIVMGAYGHSRLSEAILSGVTNLVSRHADVPVLMSH